MSQTSQFTVSNSAWSNVVAQTYCRSITIGEDVAVVGWPTTDYLLAKPTSASASRRFSGGTQYTFRRERGAFNPGDVVGQVQIIKVGSTTFFQDEADL